MCQAATHSVAVDAQLLMSALGQSGYALVERMPFSDLRVTASRSLSVMSCDRE